MRKWEDIIKEKMEEPGGALPESVFSEFRARREAAPATKRFPLVWAAVPAVAAGLAAVLLLRGPVVPEGEVPMIQQPSAPVAVVVDSIPVEEPVQVTPLIALAATPKAVRIPDPADPGEAEDTLRVTDEPISSPVNASAETVPPEETAVLEHDMASPSPFLPERKDVRKVGMKVLPAAGAIAGGGLLAAVTAPLLGGDTMADVTSTQPADPSQMQPGDPSQGGIVLDPDPPKDERTGNATHYFPLKFGLSTRFPISERLSITAGLDYSLYKSSFTYSLSGEKVQAAHYLGIPVRLDWTLSANRWMDVYLGAGLEGDWCLGATLDGKRMAKDGFSASLQGAGGIQFNPIQSVGLYLEPQINWSFASNHTVLETYRTENPLMFSVAAGLRFTFGK